MEWTHMSQLASDVPYRDIRFNGIRLRTDVEQLVLDRGPHPQEGFGPPLGTLGSLQNNSVQKSFSNSLRLGFLSGAGFQTEW